MQGGNIEKAILLSPLIVRCERGRKRRRSIMLNLPKPAVIAMQAAMGAVLGGPCAVTALAEDAPANTATQNQATSTLRGGDLVRLRSGGPVLTVKSVHGNWIICTWWHEGFGQFRTAGFPATMIEGPITLPPPAAAPQTDASLQTTGQASPTVQSGPPPGNLSNAGQANQNPTAQGANQPPTVGRVTPGLVFPQGTVQLIVPLQQGSIDGGRARPSLVLPQG